MSQIRRQPRRKTKKNALKTIKNPFHQCLAFLPVPMAKKIEHLDKIIVRHLDEFVTEPQTDMNENLFLIKQALKRQETLVNELKDQKERESKKSQTLSTEEHHQVDASEAYNHLEDFMILEHPIDFQFWRSHEDSGLNFFGLQ